jgi:hypothetical protein
MHTQTLLEIKIEKSEGYRLFLMTITSLNYMKVSVKNNEKSK